MNVVKLTRLDGLPIYVNMNFVESFLPDDNCTLMIMSGNGGVLNVAETPEKVLELAEGGGNGENYDNQHKHL